MKVVTKISMVLFCCVSLPMGGVMVLLHEGMFEAARNWSAFGVVLSLVFLVPLSHLVGYFVVMKDVREINKICLAVRKGDYSTEIALPPEGEDEHEILRLKRNLKWMVHSIACREDWLQSRLSETTEIKRKFETLSCVDPLTGVYNRRVFEERLEQAAERSRRNGQPFYLMLLDCDGFKAVNDTLGHQAGDELLRRLGEILKTSLRGATDCPFRYGGDEFGAIIGDIDPRRVREVAERIRKRFRDVRMGNATLSMGIARFNPFDSREFGLEQVKNTADQLLYQAKRQGKDQVVTQPDMDV